MVARLVKFLMLAPGRNEACGGAISLLSNRSCCPTGYAVRRKTQLADWVACAGFP